jgi:hypothetical protein
MMGKGRPCANGDDGPVKSGFYETVTDVNSDLRFFLCWVGFVLLFGCKACCSPPCFYRTIHFDQCLSFRVLGFG